MTEILLPCTQTRNTQLVNFDDSCPVLDIGEYMSLGNLLEDGLKVDDKKLKTSSGFGRKINNKLQMPPIFFIRDLVNGKNYKPGDEFFLDRTRIDYFTSLVNDNTNFVTNLNAWKRLFTYKNLTKNTILQNLFINIPLEKRVNILSDSNVAIPNTTNNPNFTFKNRTYASKPGINIQTEVSSSGLGVVDYYKGGVQSYYGHPLKPCFGSIKSTENKVTITPVNGFQWGSTQGYTELGGQTVQKNISVMFVNQNSEIVKISITLPSVNTRTNLSNDNITPNAWMSDSYLNQWIFGSSPEAPGGTGLGPINGILESFVVLNEDGQVMADMHGPLIATSGNPQVYPGFGITPRLLIGARSTYSFNNVKKYYPGNTQLLNSTYAYTVEGAYYVIGLGLGIIFILRTEVMIKVIAILSLVLLLVSNPPYPVFLSTASCQHLYLLLLMVMQHFRQSRILLDQNTLASNVSDSWWSTDDIVKLLPYRSADLASGKILSAIYYNPGYRTNILSNSLSRQSKNYVNAMSRYTGSGHPDVFTNADISLIYPPSFTGKVFENIDQASFYDYFNPNFTGIKGQTPNRMDFKNQSGQTGEEDSLHFSLLDFMMTN